MRFISIYLEYAAIPDTTGDYYVLIMRTPYVSKRYVVTEWATIDDEILGLTDWCLKYRFSGRPCSVDFFDHDYGEMERFQVLSTGSTDAEFICDCGEPRYGYYHYFGHCSREEPRLPEVWYLIDCILKSRNLK